MKQLLNIVLLVGLLCIASTAFADPRVLIDPVGRRVEVPTDPQRVVALAPSITEIVFALEQDKRLVGVTRFSDYPKAAKKLPKVGSYIYLDVERIAALRPDICIGIKDGNPIAAVERLEAFGIPFFCSQSGRYRQCHDQRYGHRRGAQCADQGCGDCNRHATAD